MKTSVAVIGLIGLSLGLCRQATAPPDYLNSNPNLCDLSLNPVTPGHVSSVDVHALIPSRPDLRWFTHLTPWFIPGEPPIGIGVNNDMSKQMVSLALKIDIS